MSARAGLPWLIAERSYCCGIERISWAVTLSGSVLPCGHARGISRDSSCVPLPAQPCFLLQPAAAARAQTASTASAMRGARSEHGVGIEHRTVHAHTLHRRARARAHLHRAAGAAADRAGHELFQRHLTRHTIAARKV